jgi:hypothetical protein
MKMFTLTKSLRGRAALFAFCAVLLNGGSLFGGDTKPGDNVFVSSPLLPASLRRVVLLPLAHENSPAELSSGCEMLGPVLQAELIKAKKFEVVTASPKAIQNLTGQAAWTGAEVLPADFFGSLQRVYGCDAVLFCQLTAFRAYPPLLIGWRMKLVDVSTQKVIWAADEVYDASDLAVSKRAQEFQKQQEGADKPQTFFRRVWTWLDRRSEPATDEPWTVLNSPRYFGQFSAAKLLQTLPER